MSIKERRDIEKKEMKNNIMLAAIEIMKQEGFEKLSIRKIAAKIDYSPTTIYLYYKDKAEIIADMSNALYRKVEENAIAVMNDKTVAPIDIQLKKILKSIIATLCDETEMAMAVMFGGANFIFENKNKNDIPTNSGIAFLDEFLDEGIAQGILCKSASKSSWMLISAILGFVMNCIQNQLYKLDHFNQLIDSFVTILVNGIIE